MKISEAIKFIVEQNDKKLLTDSKRFKSYLLDLCSDNPKELKIVKRALEDKILERIFGNERDNVKIARLRDEFDEQGMSEDWSEFVISSFAEALGWNYTPKVQNQQSQSQPQQKQKPKQGFFKNLLALISKKSQQNQQVEQAQSQSSIQTNWICSCGFTNTTKFCGNCGLPKPIPMNTSWTCSCGFVNTTKFCGNCGKPNGQQQVEKESKRKVEEKTFFDVELTEIGVQKLQVIKVVRQLTGLGLKEVKDLVEGAPKMVKELVAKEEADKAKFNLEAVGAKVTIRRADIDEEARKKSEETRRKAQEEARRKAEEEARRKAEVEARRKAEEEARRKAEEEARRKAEEEARRKVKVGDYIKFGSYPQSANGDILPIEWLVLAKENNKMLVISRYGLEARRFDSSSNNWKNSEIRKWLNRDFYNKAFSENEKKLIKPFDDYIFLLSKGEAEKYFANDEARICKLTAYALKNGVYVWSDNGCGAWWLRSATPDLSVSVFSVDSHGFILTFLVYKYLGVARPALWINL